MIEKVEILISFPSGAAFNGNLNLMIYKQFIKFMKRISCFNLSEKCVECKERSFCRYHQITGENFSGYPGIFIHQELFSKRRFNAGEQHSLVFYLIGTCKDYEDYIMLFFKNLNQRLFNSLFYLKDYRSRMLLKKEISVQCFEVSSPIESASFSDCYNRMVSYYEEHYNLNAATIETGSNLKEQYMIDWDSISFQTKRVKVNGFAGEVIDIISLDSRFIETGIGKFNYIGGGRIEIKNRDAC